MNNKGISLIALVVTIIVIIVLAAVVIFSGLDTPDPTSEEMCIMRHGEHQYITVSKYDTLNQQYYNIAVCSRCGHELNVRELKNK